MGNFSEEFRPFRGLPITREQDGQIRTYIAHCETEGRSWDTLELDYIVRDMLNPTPTDDRIEICDEYASNLANQVRRTGEKLDRCTRKAHAPYCSMFTESEWKWIVCEARRRL
ncbi:hypothetical protein V8G57_07450 [Collimonas sp. H4R21]|uniref:Uncharacterized protein n=1 Tax=Collimonas rhizosphaerae TaxID=3126357 RepID=A0ABU9PT98_9BURK